MDRKTEELLCELQAQLYAQRIALRALARTHPNPAGLLSSWREALLEASTRDPVAPPPTRHSEYIAEQVQAYAELWTAELVDLAIADPKAPPVPDLR
ncbi:hypothetical protein ACFQZQ_13225 [Lysobacter koreensis]|uniref:Uncharacterized protein n=1 Tax=Lysobacter koreensis TaxID=266122 RepID=A0ABW2YRU3_9GAMM